MENKNNFEELEQRIVKIEERNKKVEGDKRWETSIIRHILIIIFTYIFAVSYIFVADTTKPFLYRLYCNCRQKETYTRNYCS